MKGISTSIELYFWGVIYLLITLFARWQLNLTSEILFYLTGNIVGLHLLQLVGALFKTSNAPFHTLMCHLFLMIAAFYVVTSSNSLFGKGVVLSLSLRYLYLIVSEYGRTKSLTSWFGSDVSLPDAYNRLYLYLTTALFILMTLLFIRS